MRERQQEPGGLKQQARRDEGGRARANNGCKTSRSPARHGVNAGQKTETKSVHANSHARRRQCCRALKNAMPGIVQPRVNAQTIP